MKDPEEIRGNAPTLHNQAYDRVCRFLHLAMMNDLISEEVATQISRTVDDELRVLQNRIDKLESERLK